MVSAVRRRPDQPDPRALQLLYRDWFTYKDLRPDSMWLTESTSRADGVLPKPVTNVDRAFVLQLVGIEEKSLLDWRRYCALHITRLWDATGPAGLFVPSMALLEPQRQVYEVGWGQYVLEPDGGLQMDYFFGPKYGRGYSLSPEGVLTSNWVS
ncbi:hypothetical protein [Deinococcus humi]|uniref:Uncharacterized protein n=1 Tax=Deinococcus humi TaxID=662880 RepID=A0A7W8JXW1_9DEIO|nr:hypothetical protein [Deinococcus humi]MBB5363669.1 hypothetical protein [Deinococcus humi]GGO29843.1 hypothetical protein GCM10008949_23890 [Deinococcus humi]